MLRDRIPTPVELTGHRAIKRQLKCSVKGTGTLEIPSLKQIEKVSISPEGSRRASYRKGQVTCNLDKARSDLGMETGKEDSV